MMSAICSYFLLGVKMPAFWLLPGLDGYPSSLVFPTLDGSAEASLVGQLLCFHKLVTVSKVCFCWIAFLRSTKIFHRSTRLQVNRQSYSRAPTAHRRMDLRGKGG